MTISEDVSAVPAAHFLSFNIGNSKIQTTPYFQFEFPCDQNVAPNNFDILLSSDSTIARIVPPPQVIEDLLDDSLNGKNLRHAVLNFLWGGLFTEMWIKKNLNIIPST